MISGFRFTSTVTEFHTYIQFEDVNRRVDLVEDLLLTRENKIRELYRHMYQVEFVKIREHAESIEKLRDSREQQHRELLQIYNSNQFLYRRFKGLLSFARKTGRKLSRNIRNLAQRVDITTKKYERLSDIAN